MSSSNPVLAALQQRLAEKFPQAGRCATPGWLTGVTGLDELTGGLPPAALTEIVCTGPSCGGQLLLGALWHAASARRARSAWIDAHDSFDPASWPEAWLASLLWVRCRAGAAQALQVADVLVRDANLTLVLLDLAAASAAELRRMPAPFWYRLQRAVATSGQLLVVTTPRACVPSARLRLVLSAAQGHEVLTTPRFDLAHHLQPELQRQRLGTAMEVPA